MFVCLQMPYGDEAPPEVVHFDVALRKDSQQGLGITIAGYIGKDNNPGMWTCGACSHVETFARGASQILTQKTIVYFYIGHAFVCVQMGTSESSWPLLPPIQQQ